MTCSEMKALEARAFAEGVTADALMEEAGAQIAAAVAQFFPAPGRCAVHFGKGHNGGDALVAARHLTGKGWALELRPAFPAEEWSELTAGHHRKLLARPQASASSYPMIVLDGLLGIGASGELREPVAKAAAEIARLRTESHAHVFALDVPTGIDADTGIAAPGAVRADFTLTIGFVKDGLLADAATPFVGRLALLPLRELSRRAATDEAAEVSTSAQLAPLLPRRPFDVHKGDFGRIGIVAGSRGLAGAAIMAANACVRAGAGLVSLYVTEEIYPIVAGATAPEVMVRPIQNYLEVLEQNRDVLAIGPGLGMSCREEALELIAQCPHPLVLDADALNIVATDLAVLSRGAGPRLLTPHPGEMARLAPGTTGKSRRELAEMFVAQHPVTLLLKGSRSLVAEARRPLAYNTTGSAGMASGGMGDVLTGVCAALLGQGLTPFNAARASAWLCGRAAELAISFGGESEESLTATRVTEHLGAAFKELRAGCF